ncbi:DNA ligase I, ATP-dependent protein (macronuclear) [Tetrahymena thermophila SB210]|uniref:DNA ligase 1 n=1 Tax=Tetrahymena thermophila (strain SB210) TaxID=312017 RepID=I7LWR8_TETTS|nr:DNA ligase I, ATP-dependent protein [Tetrahymena thermophila SB210]EAS02727.1 DNA ligase I, ATP-dependent protein [Tetrahymena thermophila SB210]|eukprot:XP_001022972.1 DNA ligase I, ATP-dependent protein [Tetrahymena thermophila SB210]
MKQGTIKNFFGNSQKKKEELGESNLGSDKKCATQSQKGAETNGQNSKESQQKPDESKSQQEESQLKEKPKAQKRRQIIDSSDDEEVPSLATMSISNKQIKKVENENQKNESSKSETKSSTDSSNLSKQILEKPKNEDEKLSQSSKKAAEQQDTKKKPTNNLRKLLDKHFDPIEDAPFYKDQEVLFGYLCDGFERVNEQEGKNSKAIQIEIMSKIFKSIILLNPDQVYEAYMFCILKIAPDYESNELGVGREILQKAISNCCGKSVTQIRDSLNKLGDLGKVASEAKSTQKNITNYFQKQAKEKPPITLNRTFNDLKSIAAASGKDSTAERERIIIKYMNEAKPDEACYFIRFLEQNLKIGAAEKTMQAALSKAFFEIAHNIKSNHVYTEQQNQLLEEFNFNITRCLCEFPNYYQVIETLKQIGKDISKLLDICKITIGVPCKPMLAKPTKSIQVILERFKDMTFTCEYKYDGLRGQIHYDGKDVTIFSRNLENMTQMYPDIVEFIKKHVSQSKTVKNFILDSEIVAFDKNTNKIRPFQQLATRGRVNVKLDEIDIKVCVFMFDLIYINDQSLLQTTLQERRQKIQECFVQEPGEFCFAEHINTEDVEQIQEFLEKSVKVGCEGLMVKTLETNSTYEPAKRSFKWLKLKKDYLDSGLGDTLDLVPIAAFKGTGKRVGLYGAYLLACYNEDMERYETICKIGTGFSDEILEACYKFFQDKIIPQPQSDYLTKDFKADVWFKPSVVWEIKGADLQISPVYTCAISETNQEKGIGLRFPRLIRVRDDKDPVDATSPSFIYDIYKQQAVVANDFDDGDDFY